MVPHGASWCPLMFVCYRVPLLGLLIDSYRTVSSFVQGEKSLVWGDATRAQMPIPSRLICTSAIDHLGIRTALLTKKFSRLRVASTRRNVIHVTFTKTASTHERRGSNAHARGKRIRCGATQQLSGADRRRRRCAVAAQERAHGGVQGAASKNQRRDEGSARGRHRHGGIPHAGRQASQRAQDRGTDRRA